jgi:4-amino-4-deoxy-L-arabinose transferase-like glycosyltransferase
MWDRRRKWVVCALLLVTAFSFRFCVAHFLPNDNPEDGRVYAQLARNLLEQHVYSHLDQPPYPPSISRLPGYPIFLAAIYSVFGHANNTAVRIAQALLDTASCALIALIAYYWEPDEKRKRVAAIVALALAAVCPFTTIYVATILTEIPTIFLMLGICLLATFGFNASSFKRSVWWWGATGLVAGVAVFFRPDSGLFACAAGLTESGRGRRLVANTPEQSSQSPGPGHGFVVCICARARSLDGAQLARLSSLPTAGADTR